MHKNKYILYDAYLIIFLILFINYIRMISLVGRASVLCTEGRGFESRIVHIRSFYYKYIFIIKKIKYYLDNKNISSADINSVRLLGPL